MEAEVARLATEASKVLAENDTQSSRIENLQAEIQEKAQHIDGCECLITDLKSEQNCLVEKVKSAELRATDLENQYKQNLEELSIKNAQLVDTVSELRQENDTLTEKLKQQNMKIHNSRKRSIGRLEYSKTSCRTTTSFDQSRAIA